MRTQKLFLGLFLLIPFLSSSFGWGGFAYGEPHEESHRGAPRASAIHSSSKKSASVKSVFPRYPNRATTAPNLGKQPERRPVPTRSDVNGNRVNDEHLSRVDFANHRSAEVMRTDAHVNNHVTYHSATFVSNFRPIYQQKNVVFNEHLEHYHQFVIAHPLVWDAWHAHHFYGGYYYGFHPIPNIEIYFYNPMVHWFYIGTWDDQYYRTWYASEYEAYPALNRPFQYYGVYYPTDNLRQLLFGVSAMSVDKHAAFRSQINTFTQDITQQLANQLKTHVVLSKGDLVITHYEILGYDDAVVLEGAVNFQSKSHNFKGMINLNPTDTSEAHRTQAFVAVSSENPPGQDQLSSLDQLNASIESVRGDAAPAAPESNPVENAPSGEVSADPK